MPAQRLSEVAPEHMVRIAVTTRTNVGDEVRRILNGIGDVLLDGEHDFGPGLRQIRVTLHGREERTEARIRLQHAKGALPIEYSADFPDEGVDARDARPEVFERVASNVVAALEASRSRVADEVPEFDIDAFLERCRSIRDRMPTTVTDIDALLERSELRARTLRVAMNRLRQSR